MRVSSGDKVFKTFRQITILKNNKQQLNNTAQQTDIILCLCLKPFFIHMASDRGLHYLLKWQSVLKMGHNTNCVNPDETPHNVASGQGLHFLLTECRS